MNLKTSFALLFILIACFLGISSQIKIEAPKILGTSSLKPSSYQVKRVIDGDTFELADGQKVRLIGIDSPESVDPRKPVQCFGAAASQKAKEILEGKYVTLEKDLSETDRYGRLLRYVWIEDIFINKYLVETGFATARSYLPDIAHQSELSQAELVARKNQLGLWGSACASPQNAD